MILSDAARHDMFVDYEQSLRLGKATVCEGLADPGDGIDKSNHTN